MSDREKAMKWWNGLKFFVKERLADGFYNRYMHSLTGREIEFMYNQLNIKQ
jgi:hypothetical protein